MKNKKLIIGLIIGVIILGVIIFLGIRKPVSAPEGANNSTNTTVSQNEVSRFSQSFINCQNDSLTITDPNSGQSVTLSVLGLEENKCHYQMELTSEDTGSHGINCLFPQSVLKPELLNQLTGNDEGLSGEIQQYCQRY